MVIDTSVIVAILQDEPESEFFTQSIKSADSAFISAATYVETSVVVTNRADSQGTEGLDHLLATTNIEVIPFDLKQADIACKALRDFGKGRHPARLNFGDCFSYALAKSYGEPLLFKGNDFSKTDIHQDPSSREVH